MNCLECDRYAVRIFVINYLICCDNVSVLQAVTTSALVRTSLAGNFESHL